jgi:hypothetical protein
MILDHIETLHLCIPELRPHPSQLGLGQAEGAEFVRHVYHEPFLRQLYFLHLVHHRLPWLLRLLRRNLCSEQYSLLCLGLGLEN